MRRIPDDPPPHSAARFLRDGRAAERGRAAGNPAMWMLPALTFAGCALFVVLVGVSTGVGPAVYLPLALAVGIVLAGLPVMYMLPRPPEDEEDDEEG